MTEPGITDAMIMRAGNAIEEAWRSNYELATSLSSHCSRALARAALRAVMTENHAWATSGVLLTPTDDASRI